MPSVSGGYLAIDAGRADPRRVGSCKAGSIADSCSNAFLALLAPPESTLTPLLLENLCGWPSLLRPEPLPSLPLELSPSIESRLCLVGVMLVLPSVEP